MNRIKSHRSVWIKVCVLAIVVGGSAGVALQRFSQAGATNVRLSVGVPRELVLQAPETVSYVVRSANRDVLSEGVLAPAPAAAKSPLKFTGDLVLPAGVGHVVSFSAAGARGSAIDIGTRAFDVVAGKVTDVVVGPNVPGIARFVSNAEITALPETGGSNGRAQQQAGDTPPNAGLSATAPTEACRRCQLASTVPLCDPVNLTATSKTNQETGEQTPIGWGCATLPNEAARAACSALLACMSATGCARPAQNPVMGCFCGAATPTACFASEGITGACIDAYHAAAAANPDGPVAGAAPAQLSSFIATAASDPRTVLGLANNLQRCALDAGCAACDGS